MQILSPKILKQVLDLLYANFHTDEPMSKSLKIFDGKYLVFDGKCLILVYYKFCHASRMCIGDYIDVSCYIVTIVFM